MAIVQIRGKNKNHNENSFFNQLGNDYLKSIFPSSNHEKWRKIELNEIMNQFSKAIDKNNKYLKWELESLSKKDNKGLIRSWQDWESDPSFSHKLQKITDILKYQYGANEPEPDFISAYAEYNLNKKNIMILRIPKNFKAEDVVSLKLTPVNGFTFHWIIIYLEENSGADIYLDTLSTDSDIGVRQIYLEKNAQLNLFSSSKDHHHASNSVHIEKIHLENDATANIFQFTSGHKNGIHFSDIQINRNAYIYYHSLQYAIHGNLNTEINVLHKEDYSHSLILQKSLIDNHSRSIFRGNIIIPKGTKKCTGEQQNKNLLLGKNCISEAIPQLEITTDDVEAAHGSATGELDDEQLFYLQSRGLRPEEAKSLLMVSFFEDILNKSLGYISHEKNKEKIRNILWQDMQEVAGFILDNENE